ncbi:nucleotidyltransferase domain-containing protein [Desulfofundulus thermobenzoicus]|nr:nucleotidyltransferase domain-containing protein [Desulfofundulus thermobenzoicus]
MMLLKAQKLYLLPDQREAIKEVKALLQSRFPVEELMVFGSAARGEAAEESDLDLLVLTSRPMSHSEKHAISDLIFEVNLSRGTNISILVVDRKTWETGLWSLLPIHQEIIRDGVTI